MSWKRLKPDVWFELERQRFNVHAISSLELSPIEDVASRAKFR
jgi:hypothetical protein